MMHESKCSIQMLGLKHLLHSSKCGYNPEDISSNNVPYSAHAAFYVLQIEDVQLTH